MIDKYRIWFNKIGVAKYISHLDLMRTFTRMLRQSHLPVWYTEGFNPHPFLTFAAPLSLGVEALNEPFDIKLTEPLPVGVVLKALQDVQTPALPITAVTLPLKKFSEVTAAEFEITLQEEVNLHEIESIFNGEIIFTKPAKIKRGKRIAEKQFSAKINLTDVKNADNYAVLSMILPQGQTNNVNINLVTDYLANEIGAKLENIRRLMLFCDDKPLR